MSSRNNSWTVRPKHGHKQSEKEAVEQARKRNQAVSLSRRKKAPVTLAGPKIAEDGSE